MLGGSAWVPANGPSVDHYETHEARVRWDWLYHLEADKVMGAVYPDDVTGGWRAAPFSGGVHGAETPFDTIEEAMAYVEANGSL